ncbi:MAG: hypothetical protein ACOX5N_03415 [Bacilli bacterium]
MSSAILSSDTRKLLIKILSLLVKSKSKYASATDQAERKKPD